MTNFSKELNTSQRAAVTHTTGPSIILAGAGSGKTRVLTYKAMYLLEKNIAKASNILMLTFTNKAAKEMKHRITTYIDKDLAPQEITATTFHSFCASVLRRNKPVSVQTSNFIILDSSDQTTIMKQLLKQQSGTLKISAYSALNRISDYKNRLLTPAQAISEARDFFEERSAELYKKYQNVLEKTNAFDFDDLLTQTVWLFEQKKIVLSRYHTQYRFLLVDEYQDTNHAQYMLAKLLSSATNNITVVGDFSQSIYSWRGADFTNLKKFKNDFPLAKTFNLEQNYRSTEPILTAAYSVIEHNTTHPILKLWTDKKYGDEVGVFTLENDDEESDFVLGRIQKLSDQGYSLDDIAVLYRTNAQSRMLEELCLRSGVPYRIYGGVRFYERKEIKDVLSFLRNLINPKDELAYTRIDKLGKKRSRIILSKLEQIRNEWIVREDKNTGELIQHILDTVPYLELYDSDIEEDMNRLDNIKELISVAYTFPKLIDFLDTVTLIESGYEFQDTATKKLNLMTIHAAKGLEFGVVFVVGLEDGLLPHSRSVESAEQLEEERRLLYVAITRAKDQLFLSWAKRRMVYGRTQYSLPSQFLTESHLLEYDDVTF
ncbi:MAG: UvrD-helicase domain-containing protein [Candidatus Roizmanbacteria bacterium]|nr:UvrD-helicase domain-containing protein [Candidatus Roizmanbacteria bacterium]